jgi:hypothetical protein
MQVRPPCSLQSDPSLVLVVHCEGTEIHRQVGVISAADEREREDTPNGVEEERGRATHQMENLEPTRYSLVLAGLFHTYRA